MGKGVNQYWSEFCLHLTEDMPDDQRQSARRMAKILRDGTSPDESLLGFTHKVCHAVAHLWVLQVASDLDLNESNIKECMSDPEMRERIMDHLRSEEILAVLSTCLGVLLHDMSREFFTEEEMVFSFLERFKENGD